MKVWLAYCNERYESCTVIGVCATEELADACCAKCSEHASDRLENIHHYTEYRTVEEKNDGTN